jgi:hypothetical protein
MLDASFNIKRIMPNLEETIPVKCNFKVGNSICMAENYNNKTWISSLKMQYSKMQSKESHGWKLHCKN